MTRLAPTRVSAEEAARAHAEIPTLEDVQFRTSDGLTLRGWYVRSQGGAALIFVHGGGSNRLALLPEARMLARHGYGFLVYDSRASGDSDGNTVTWGDREQLDLAAALDYVSARADVDPRRIGLVGLSIGGSTVAMTGARDPRARAVVLYATWPSLEREIRQNYSPYGAISRGSTLLAMRLSGVDPDNVRPIDVVGQIAPRPLLMITGGRDGDTPPSVMMELFAAAGEPKAFWMVPASGHGGYFQSEPTEYENRVVGFLGDALSRDSVRPKPP